LKEGEEWDRIAKLCEFNSKNSRSTSDLSRLKSILLQLKTPKE
uniref:Clathrin light chain n=1 Tax=Gongylonema pulchrum TaxID=637853 RepID=A0A183ESH2_9BILA